MVRASRNICQYLSNKMQQYTVYLYLHTALHVSSGFYTHHQELISLYLQHLASLRPLLLPDVNVSVMPVTVDTVIWSPDDGCRNHSKHVQRFAGINKRCIEIKWNVNLMQPGNFIDILLARHVSGTYAHHQEH